MSIATSERDMADYQTHLPLGGVSGLAKPNIVREHRGDGSFVLRSAERLLPYDRCIGDWLCRWASRTPDAVFLAERSSIEGSRTWRTVTYAQALEQVRRIGQSLLDLELDFGRPIVALSDNSVNLGLLSLAVMHVGGSISIISSAYSRVASGRSRLYSMLDQINPCLIYAEDASHYGDVIGNYGAAAPAVYTLNSPADALSFETLIAAPATSAVDAAFEKILGSTPARMLLTSGSTGKPKLVVNTHQMLCANQQMISQCWHFVDQHSPVVLDWLPWSHTFGANHNFNLVLRNGGTLYIDDGRPMPGKIERTLENIREVRPTLFFNVPKGFDALLPYLENDPSLADALFGRLQMLFFAAAALPQKTADRLRAVAAQVGPRRIFLTTEWGSTETAPVVTSAHFESSDAKNIGVPVPGVELKFVPAHGKLEMRVRGESVFAEYRGDPEKTAEAFDEEGFYRIGDAGQLARADDPNAGIIFDGRVAEDFKLTTGTWVSVGPLRLRILSGLAPYAQDIVIAGHDRDEIGILIFPGPALRALAQDAEGAMTGAELVHREGVRDVLTKQLKSLSANVGSSQKPARALLLSAPPSLELGEVTDKGYVNQRVVLALRELEVQTLFSDADAVIRVQ
ncbi:feruloyl-CoA synthase [Paraburkholderia sp. BL27I4N3]|uniref:feruloyl-CoA synthase n=1 Tax=Paraburkholderia sp. BL27I4N3 TaxID=1938805 RepID=UPI000E38B7C3|nr:feruloyl-CoA synthase [Paraburkholderia sp. BL27I4N3]REE06613.1 feruloyl-CoA synthase [Paraburkholderia sp. BL27I4N3]